MMRNKLKDAQKKSLLEKYNSPPKIVRNVTGAGNEEFVVSVKYDSGEHAIRVESVVSADGAVRTNSGKGEVAFSSWEYLKNIDRGSAYLFANANARADIRKHICGLSEFDARQMIAAAVADAVRGRLGETLYLFELFQKGAEIPFVENGGMLWKYREHLETARPALSFHEVNVMLGFILDNFSAAPKKCAAIADDYIKTQSGAAKRPADQKVFNEVMEKIFRIHAGGQDMSLWESLSPENMAKLNGICDAVERTRNGRAKKAFANPLARIFHGFQIKCL
jgi:hypothetical protein